MRSFALSIVFAFLASAAASCSGDDGRADTGPVGCSPGQQVSCGCPGGGVDGFQICDQAGVAFGACMGCGEGTGEGSSTSTTTVDDESTSDITTTTPMDSTGPIAEESEVTGPPGGSESGSGGFVWIWTDHGGPAFLPPPCAGAAGVADGLLVDPQAFFNALVAGADPNDWDAVLNAIEGQLWGCGLGQQRDSGGVVRGRLYLPVDACPDASPPADDPEAMFLGVRQDPACWDHFVDVVSEL